MLINKPKNKASKIITQKIHDGLSQRVNDPHNPFLGYWDAQNWVKDQYNIDVKYQRIREYLIQHLKQNQKHHVNLIIKKINKLKSFFKNYLIRQKELELI